MPPSKAHHRKTLPDDRIPLKEKLGFSFGLMASTGTGGISGQLLGMVFVMLRGVSPAVLSTVGFINSIAMSMLGPFLAQYYDNFRSPWGRRRPLMMSAFVPMCLIFATIFFFPVGMNEHGTFLWLLVLLPLSGIAGSFYGGPLGALMIEATPDYHERIRMNTFLGFFLAAMGLSFQWIFPLIQCPVFSNPIQGLHIVVGGIAVLFAALAFAPIALCPEKGSAAVVAKARPKVALLQSLRDARKNRPFCTVILVRCGFWFCYTVVGSLGVYMNTYFIYGGNVKRAAATYAVLGSSYMVASMLSLSDRRHDPHGWLRVQALRL